MTRKPWATGALKAFIGKESERILASCTSCGKCVEACPMSRYRPAPSAASSGAVAAGVLSLLRGEPGTPEALGWVSVCVRSGCCVAACPDKVDPRTMVRIARMIALGGLGAKPQIKVREDREFFDRIRAYAALQLSEDEMRDWM